MREAYYACRYDEADTLLGDLPETTHDRYLRISFLYMGCMIDMIQCNMGRFLERYGKLKAEFQEDFPHKIELQEYLFQINAMLGQADYYTREFKVVPGYDYHESFLPRLAELCAVSLVYPGGDRTRACINNVETTCRFLERQEAWTSLQSIHMTLSGAYGYLGMRDESVAHLRKAIRLAWDHDLYFYLAEWSYYTDHSLMAAFSGMPSELRDRIETASEDIQERYVRFMEGLSRHNVYELMSSKDTVLVHYVVGGFTNKEIARRLHVSTGYVGKRLGEIYASLGVKGRRELIELYTNSVSGAILE